MKKELTTLQKKSFAVTAEVTKVKGCNTGEDPKLVLHHKLPVAKVNSADILKLELVPVKTSYSRLLLSEPLSSDRGNLRCKALINRVKRLERTQDG